MNTKLRQFFIFFIGLGVSIGLDQFTKHLAVVHLKGQKPFVLIKGVFEFYYSENRAAGTAGILLPDCSGSHSGGVVGGLPDAGRETVSAADVQLVSARIRRSWQYDRPSDTEICGGFPVF